VGAGDANEHRVLAIDCEIDDGAGVVWMGEGWKKIGNILKVKDKVKNEKKN
jgi:hypothetical protein